MPPKRNRIPWDEGIHDESELWVCPSCDAHLHRDSVGDECPACGEPIDEDRDDDNQ